MGPTAQARLIRTALPRSALAGPIALLGAGRRPPATISPTRMPSGARRTGCGGGELVCRVLTEHGVGVSDAQALVSWSHPVLPRRCCLRRARRRQPASRQQRPVVRHRLNRGGDRDLNRALHDILLTRRRTCPRARAYVTRRRAEGKSDAEIRRCLKQLDRPSALPLPQHRHGRVTSHGSVGGQEACGIARLLPYGVVRWAFRRVGDLDRPRSRQGRNACRRPGAASPCAPEPEALPMTSTTDVDFGHCVSAGRIRSRRGDSNPNRPITRGPSSCRWRVPRSMTWPFACLRCHLCPRTPAFHWQRHWQMIFASGPDAL
jgi:hypothetical protein